jgi:hypothetical protein
VCRLRTATKDLLCVVLLFYALSVAVPSKKRSASPRVIRPRAWPDWPLRGARSTARCLSGVPGAGRKPDAMRESARARRRAIIIRIRMMRGDHNKNTNNNDGLLIMIFQSVPQPAILAPQVSFCIQYVFYHPWPRAWPRL